MTTKENIESRERRANEFTLYFTVRTRAGEEQSDHEVFTNKEDAELTLNAYRLTIDRCGGIVDYYFWDDEGNIYSLVSDGKVNEGWIKIR